MTRRCRRCNDDAASCSLIGVCRMCVLFHNLNSTMTCRRCVFCLFVYVCCVSDKATAQYDSACTQLLQAQQERCV